MATERTITVKFKQDFQRWKVGDIQEFSYGFGDALILGGRAIKISESHPPKDFLSKMASGIRQAVDPVVKYAEQAISVPKINERGEPVKTSIQDLVKGYKRSR
jgi:hypothetical protein